MKTEALAIANLAGDRVRALWEQRAGRPGRSAPAISLDGRRVLTLESRRSPELALLVMNYGGTPVVAPSLREVPLESNHQALTFAKDLIEQRFGMVVLMTGVGVRLLIKVVEPVYGRETFVQRAGADPDRRARSQARGRASRGRVDVVGHRAQPEHVARASGHAGCPDG